ncbi:MAG TPA: type II toxin-antitoxin system PemK/MazF family toxin [Patescibacteria group bacterium]|nr:type II toxin-antitoxin system PemK/MazF family toxin [Patescibacteria group bacterium]
MYQIVKFNFPFADDFNKGKPRPALAVSPSFGRHNQLIISYITTNVEDKLETDLFIDPRESDFRLTGLRSASLIKLHRLITVTPSQLGIIGMLPDTYIPAVKEKLVKVFQLK